jgi:hypothetical protein
VDSRVFGPSPRFERYRAYKKFWCARCRTVIGRNKLCCWVDPDNEDPYCDACCAAVENGTAP